MKKSLIKSTLLVVALLFVAQLSFAANPSPIIQTGRWTYDADFLSQGSMLPLTHISNFNGFPYESTDPTVMMDVEASVFTQLNGPLPTVATIPLDYATFLIRSDGAYVIDLLVTEQGAINYGAPISYSQSADNLKHNTTWLQYQVGGDGNVFSYHSFTAEFTWGTEDEIPD